MFLPFSIFLLISKSFATSIPMNKELLDPDFYRSCIKCQTRNTVNHLLEPWFKGNPKYTQMPTINPLGGSVIRQQLHNFSSFKLKFLWWGYKLIERLKYNTKVEKSSEELEKHNGIFGDCILTASFARINSTRQTLPYPQTK